MKSFYVKFLEENKELETIVRVHDAVDVISRILRDWPEANILRIIDIEALDDVEADFVFLDLV